MATGVQARAWADRFPDARIWKTDLFARDRNPGNSCNFSYPRSHERMIMAITSGASNRSARIANGGILHDRQEHLALLDH
jgi:hypothetical protein